MKRRMKIASVVMIILVILLVGLTIFGMFIRKKIKNEQEIIAEYNIVYGANEEYNLTLTAKQLTNAIANNQFQNEISIYDGNNNLLQKISYEAWYEGYVYPTLEDLNEDGYKDLNIQTYFRNTRVDSIIYVWDKEQDEFRKVNYDGVLGVLFWNEEKGCLYNVREDVCVTEVLVWEGNTLVKESEKSKE